MKRISLVLIPSMLVLGLAILNSALTISGDSFKYNSWGQLFGTEHKPNLINLWSTHSFKGVTLLKGWTYWQSGDRYWIQGCTTGDFGLCDFLWGQIWEGSKSALYLDWQEIHYDSDSEEVMAGWKGGLRFTGTGWEIVTYGWAGGSAYWKKLVGPVPEPATMLLLGSGLIGLLGLRKRFRNT